MPSCDLRVFTLIVFDMVILFNTGMETFEKYPNKCMGHMFGGGGRGSDFCVTQNFYHLTQSETMDSEVFPLLWDIVRTVCNV